MKQTVAAWLLVTTAALAGAAVAQAEATTVTTSEQLPLALFALVPCANDGAGDFVVLEGTLHVVTHVTTDARGAVHAKQHFQPQAVSGVGIPSGDTYRGTGVTQTQSNTVAGTEVTFINNFRVIGPGPNNNFLVHLKSHVTITPNGDVTTSADNLSIECR